MFVYSVSYVNKLDSLFNNGFSRQFLASNEGTDYGDGVYCNINIEDSLNRWNTVKHIGGCILKLEIVGGLDRYLIFNGRLASEVYGECSIQKQVYTLFGEDADKVWRDFSNIMKYDIDARQHFNGRTAELLQVLLSPRRKSKLMSILPPEDRGRNIRAEYEALFKKHNIRGAVYRGMKDGLCLVAYDFGDCQPFAYSIDGGRTWKKRDFKGHTVDMHKKFGLKYKNIDYPIQVETNDGIYEFSRVQKKNGKYNYIIGETGQELSPVDFDSVTLINPETGEFEIEYQGEWYLGCPYGFFVNEVEYEMGHGHTYDELLDMNNMEESLERKFNDILESAMKEAFKTILEGRNFITEEIIDEVKYGEYEMPTIEDLGKQDTVTLYHITPKASVEGIFKFGFDREYLAKNANVYGRGVYTTTNITDSASLIGPHYGDSMLQLKLIGGFDRFLIFEENLAKKYYGKNWKILDQLKTMFSTETAHKIYNNCYLDTVKYSKIAGQYNIRGVMYNWGGSIACLVFDISSVIPYAVSYDRGKTFTTKIDDTTIHRTMTSVDVDYRYGHRYKSIDKAIEGQNSDGEPTGYARVKKNNGKYNYIDIQNGQEISPVDFDSVTLMDPDSGEFEIEYQGEWYLGCPFGFFVNEVEYEMGEGHTYDELLDIDNE